MKKIIFYLSFLAVAIGLISQIEKDKEYPIYPDPELTPGAVMSVSKNEVCVPGYAKLARDVSKKDREAVFERYGIDFNQPRGAYEVDHFIPLALGGSNAVENLWPQPRNPEPGFPDKDKLEFYLWRFVCADGISLDVAQEEIRADWVKAFEKYLGDKLGALDEFEPCEEGCP